MIETVIEIYFINIYILYLRSAFIGSSSRYVGQGADSSAYSEERAKEKTERSRDHSELDSGSVCTIQPSSG